MAVIPIPKTKSMSSILIFGPYVLESRFRGPGGFLRPVEGEGSGAGAGFSLTGLGACRLPVGSPLVTSGLSWEERPGQTGIGIMRVAAVSIPRCHCEEGSVN